MQMLAIKNCNFLKSHLGATVSSCLGGCLLDPIDPFLFKMPPPLDENEGPSSEVGEVGRLELSNLTLSTGSALWSRKTVVLVTNEAFLFSASFEAEGWDTSATFRFGENVKDDLLPWLNGVDTPDDPLNKTSLRSELEVTPLVGDLDLSLNLEEW